MNIVMIVLFLLGLTLCIYWHKRENAQLIRTWKTELGIEKADDLARFAWSRSMQFLVTLGACMLIIFIYDWQLKNARLLVETDDSFSCSPATPQNLPPTPAPPDAIGFAPVPEVTPPTVTDVYSPEANSSDTQSQMDVIKKRYEDILVTHLFLKKCGTVAQTDYHIITSALSQEMASINAPGRMQYDILTAAQGSYSEMYAGGKCNPETVSTLQEQYNNYIGSLTSSHAPAAQ